MRGSYMDEPLVSIIIPTYNSESTLDVCLNSIKDQTYKNIEIIIVDKFSTDNTKGIAKKYTNKILEKGPERSTQFNFASKHANRKYIYRVDSDFIVGPKVVEECIAKCEHEGFDAIAVHNTSDPTISFWSKVRKFERDMYKDDEINIGARFFKKSIFEAVGGFDESLVAGEDYDIHNKFLRMGCKIGKIESEEIHIGEPKTLIEIAKKHYYYGKTIGDFIKKNPDRADSQLNPVRGAYVRHWKEFLWHPILSLGFFIYQIVRYSSAGLGYISIKVKK